MAHTQDTGKLYRRSSSNTFPSPLSLKRGRPLIKARYARAITGHAMSPRILRTVLVILLALVVSGCGSQLQKPTIPSLPKQAPSEQLANELVATGNIAQAAQVYAELARIETDPVKRISFQLSAAELYFDSDFYDQGAQIVATLPPQLADAQLQQRRSILDAYLLLAQRQPEQALQRLPQARVISDRNQRIRVLEIQARSHELMGDSVQALKTRILLEANLSTPEAVNRNRELIWQMLERRDSSELQTMARTPGGSIYRGWLEYALLSKAANNVSAELLAQRNQTWRNRYPNHPAASRLPEGANTLSPTLEDIATISTNQVALLLPLSGQFSELGDAIKNGFIAARFAEGGTSSIRLYDTRSTLDDALEQYDLAVAEGATLIIGPLNKSAVISLAANNRVSVPTVSLNYVGDDVAGHANLYQFGLLPEDNARDVAHYALKDKYRKAIIIAADSALSQRLAIAFENTFNANGGQVLGTEIIEEDSYDFSPQLKKLLAINSSHSRKRQLSKLLDADLKFEPAIRSDIDVIFMAVGTEQARLLRPQLQFHHAGKLPLFSTAQVFSGEPDAQADSDLTGIKYNDIPWILTDAIANTRLYQSLSQQDQQPSPGLSRLKALGIDAYNIHSQIENMRLNALYSHAGKTGELSLTEGNRIRRRLQWAEFVEGVPQKISDALDLQSVLPKPNRDL